MLHAVIMAGGTGTRFWPLSRKSQPKQFLTLEGDKSLIQSVVDRCNPMVAPERFWVVTNESLVELTRQQLPQVRDAHLIAEPCGRNTAPCIGLAALMIAAEDPESIMLVMPADHLIRSHQQFQQSVERAVENVNQDADQLVLFGIRPTYPATGFGYIETGEANGESSFQVRTFREKPDQQTARRFLESQQFLWNSGIFVWKSKTILDALRSSQPKIAECLDNLCPALGSPNWKKQLADVFPEMPSISIDYAVLEQYQQITVVEAAFDWDDVGNWEAMSRLHSADSLGNTTIGPACLVNSAENVVYTQSGHVVSLLGMENCLVVHTPDATLVARRDDENGLRELVKALSEQGYDGVL